MWDKGNVTSLAFHLTRLNGNLSNIENTFLCGHGARVPLAKASCGLFPLLDCLLIHLQVDIASIPDSHSLHEHTLLLALLNIADHVEPSTHVEFMALDPLKNMYNVDICDDMRC
jgi:hypothetical protein